MSIGVSFLSFPLLYLHSIDRHPPCQAPAVCSPPHFQAPYATVTYREVTFADVAVSYTYEAVSYPAATYQPVTSVSVTYPGVTYAYVAVTYGYVSESSPFLLQRSPFSNFGGRFRLQRGPFSNFGAQRGGFLERRSAERTVPRRTPHSAGRSGGTPSDARGSILRRFQPPTLATLPGHTSEALREQPRDPEAQLGPRGGAHPTAHSPPSGGV